MWSSSTVSITRALVWLGVSCAIALLPGCKGGGPDASGFAGAMETGGAGGAGGTGGASGTGGAGAIVACAAGQSCPAGFICVPDPRATCTAGTPCPNVCLSGSGLCLHLTPPDGGSTAQCPPGQYVVACRPNSCEGSNDCAACVDGTGTACDPGSPCPVGQLCLLVLTCATAGSCGSVCVVP